MLQESAPTSWDFRAMWSGPSVSLQMFMLFLLVICLVTSSKLMRLWRIAPPFRAQRLRDNTAYLPLLQSSVASLKQWISFTYLRMGHFCFN